MELTEIRIKEMIIERYGSIKKFCETIGMPWTTLDSILKRGIANSNITNVMKITKELRVDTESLASGIILSSARTNINEVTAKEPTKIMQYYELLNSIGKHEATKRVEELTHLPKYTKEDEDRNNIVEFSKELTPDKDYLLPNAAHADESLTEITEEMIKAEDDIMDNL